MILQSLAELLKARQSGRVLEREPANDDVVSMSSVSTGKTGIDGIASTDQSVSSNEARSVKSQQKTRAVAGRSVYPGAGPCFQA